MVIGVSFVILVYAYAGYPLLIALLAHFFPLDVKSDDSYLPKVSALIPVYNGVAFVRSKLDSLLQMDYPQNKLEILICSDTSNDGTDEILNEYESRYPERVQVFRMESRSGKPSILNRLRKHASGEVLLMTDIRQPLVKQCLLSLTRLLADPSVAVVGGQLVLTETTGPGIYWRYENWIRACEARFRGLVGVSGSIYAIKAHYMEDLPADVILDDVWIPAIQRLKHRKVLRSAEAIAFDKAEGNEQEFRRKTRTLGGNYQLFFRLPGLLLPFVNPSWFEMMSHKVFRLLCPWALVSLLLACVWIVLQPKLAGGQLTYQLICILLIAQVTFYLMAIGGSRSGRLGQLARTFVILNLAAVLGLWRFLTGKLQITW